MSKSWFSAAELAGLPGMPGADRNVRIKAQKEQFEVRKKLKGKGYEYHIDSLPTETRAHLKAQQITQQNEELKGQMLPITRQEQAEAKGSQAVKATSLIAINSLPQGAQKRVMARVAILKAREAYVSALGSIVEAERRFVTAYNERQIHMPEGVYELVASLGHSTLRRWVKRVEAEGYMALAGSYQSPRKGKGSIQQQPELEQFLVALITAKPHLLNQAKSMLRLIEVKAKEFPHWQLPSQSALRRWSKGWLEQNQAAFAYLTNPDAYNSRHRPLYASMYPWLSGPNQIWEFDSTPTDVMLNAGGKLKRYSLIAAIDVYTRRPKVLLSPTSDSEGICLLFRRCLLDWGMLESDGLARTDNGSDYVSSRVQGIFDLLGIEQSRTNAFSGWEKPYIERFFRSLSAQLLEILPGYIGHSVSDRQQIEAAKAFAQRIGAKNKRQNEREALELALTPDELQQIIDQWVEHDYLHTVHDGFKDQLKGKTPFQVYTESGYRPKRVAEPHALDLLLNNIGEATVIRGSIKAGGVKYTAPELMESVWDRQRVRVFLDPQDVGRATLYKEGDYGTYVEAVNMDLIGRDIDPAQFRQARKSDRKVLAAFRKQAKELQLMFGIDSIHAEQLAKLAAENGSLQAFPQNSGVSDNPALVGLEAAVRTEASAYTDTERELLERKARQLADSKQKLAEQEQKVVRNGHQQAEWLTLQSLERELTKNEQKWLKEFRIKNRISAKRLDRLVEKESSRHRAG